MRACSLPRLLAVVAIATLGLGASGCKDKTASAKQLEPGALAAHLEPRAPREAADAGAPPQIEDTALPPATSDDLNTRMRHLVEAIAQDTPELAGDVLFPRDAYLMTRDSADAAKGWEKKVSLPFRRSIERQHKRTRGIAQARFVSFELGHSVVQITPKKKDWKRPLWRVKGSKLSYSIDGKTKTLEIAEMTAWRGAWYITRLR